VQAIVSELGVRYVLDGCMRKANDRVRITAQLIDGDSGSQIWTEKFNRDLGDIFATKNSAPKALVFVARTV